jgi:uncharacterized membrane protein YeaQ/YmgE (transglycosylase-associated protein family)
MQISNEGILVILFVGLVAGWLAGKVVRGTGFGIIGDIIVGIAGALLASLVFPRLGIHLGTGLVSEIIFSAIGAVVLLLIVRLFRGLFERDGLPKKRGPSRKDGPFAFECSGRATTIALLNDLNDPAGARLDQHRAAVYDRVAVVVGAIFRRHVIIGHARFRQNRTDPDRLAIFIGGAALLDHIAVEAGTLVDA